MKRRILVNAAGLNAPAIAAMIAGLGSDYVPVPHYAKGNYFSLAGKASFSRHIYPVLVPGGLGVHLTLDLGGYARFGPDAEWVDKIDYAVDPKELKDSTPRSGATGPEFQTTGPGLCRYKAEDCAAFRVETGFPHRRSERPQSSWPGQYIWY